VPRQLAHLDCPFRIRADGTTLAAVLVTTPKRGRLLPRSSRPPRPRSPRLCSLRRGAVSARTRPASLWRRIWWLPCQARVGGGRLLPSYHAGRLRARVIVSRSLRLRPCATPASFLVPREGRCCRSVHRWIIRQVLPPSDPRLFGPPLSQIWPFISKIEIGRVLPCFLEVTELPGCGLSREFSCVVPIHKSAAGQF